jgi:hypothetical protein
LAPAVAEFYLPYAMPISICDCAQDLFCIEGTDMAGKPKSSCVAIALALFHHM